MKLDIRLVVKSKNIQLYKKIPSFIFWLFESLIHQKEINYILDRFDNLKGVEFIKATLDYLNIKRSVIDSRDSIDDNICLRSEEKNPVIFVSNHPLGGVDGFVLAEAIVERYGDVRIVVNDILLNVYPVKELFIPINKHGRQSSDNAKMLNETLSSKIPILYFPAGLCSRKIDGRVTDLVWHKSFLKKAIEYNRDIVPIYVDSLNSKFFYNVALLRKRSNIKANLEMVLLPSELFKKRGKEIKIIFGERIECETFCSSGEVKSTVEKIREYCYSLKS